MARTIPMAPILIVLVSGLTLVWGAWRAGASAEEAGGKGELIVSKFMPGPITMRVDYVWRGLSWNLVDTPVSQGSDLTYRFPSDLPGCGALAAWGFDRAKLTLSNVSGEICTAEFSICTKRLETLSVQVDGCTSDLRQ